ncbi:tRNA lysidine(34) synthetase TilS [Mycoplasmopsis glycophila]|uniref:tRNA(Ile)-lysidine synthase n=1 Tax=Mycoplasmopsis glycophila TaxID=171285 RepID=A0A449AU93_9BACT|nr:tRNA lysidine(34) synthetase TilS [Mycoplasmopsis glycophila]VEU70048.1 tRNA(Ile)-lysidine synthase [Mycoplasmopsis glycophila]
MKKQKYLIGVSGGADSMFLLSKYKHKNIVVAYVNYNQRLDAHLDQELVEKYCKENNIPLEVLVLQKNDYEHGNFQTWARKQRYEFFKKIYQKNRCDVLLLAHHKDDFLESVLMQQNRNKNIFYYGIKKTNFVFGMKTKRPLLHRYWKNQILKKCKKNNIPYRDDYTNFETNYTRNKYRQKINLFSRIKKEALFYLYLFKNIKLISNERKANIEFQIWEESLFEQEILKSLFFQKKLIYKFLWKFAHEENLNLTDKILTNIQEFILSKNRTSKYKITNNLFLIKKQGKLSLSKITPN